jgi:hypothetical protein
VRWIDWVRGGRERSDDMQPSLFVRIPYAGQVFLCSMERGWPFGGYPEWLDEFWHPRWWPPIRPARTLPRGRDDFVGWFAMEERAAESFLNALSAIVRNGRDNLPESLELPRLDPAGFGFGGDEAGLDRRRPPNTGMLRVGAPPPARRRAGRLGTGCGFREKVCEQTDHLLVLVGKMRGRSAGRRRRLLLLQIAMEPAAERRRPERLDEGPSHPTSCGYLFHWGHILRYVRLLFQVTDSKRGR